MIHVGIFHYSVAVCTSAIPGYDANTAAALHLIREFGRREVKLTSDDWKVCVLYKRANNDMNMIIPKHDLFVCVYFFNREWK